MALEEEDPVARKMAEYVKTARWADPAWLGRVIGGGVGMLPIDMLVAQSRECQDDPEAIAAAADRLAAGPNGAIWIGHMLAVGEVTSTVLDIAAKALRLIGADHPLAGAADAPTRAAMAVYDMAVEAGRLHFAPNRGVQAFRRGSVVVIDAKDPIGSWIVGDASDHASLAGRGGFVSIAPASSASRRSSAGRLGSLLRTSVERPDHVQWLGSVVAVAIGSATPPSDTLIVGKA